MNVSHLLVCHGTWTYLIGTPSKRNQFQWGFGGRNTPLCSLRASAVAASAWGAAPSQAGTPTVDKNTVNTKPRVFWRKAQLEKSKSIFTRRYCARATFCGILRYKPPVISQACKNTHFNWAHAKHNFTRAGLSTAADDTVLAAMTYLLKETWVRVQNTGVY